jgi:hypothetical protein
VGSGRRVTAGGFAVSAGFQAIHSQRFAVAKAPDKMLWMFRIVFCHRLAHVRLASCAPAVMIPVAWTAARAPVRSCIVGHHRSTTLADNQKSLVG